MIQSTYDWLLGEKEASSDFLAQAKKAGLDQTAANILYQRGIRDQQDLEKFLNPNLNDLHDPFLLNDMDLAVDRIRLAIAGREQILIYGDYDADGMTSASILKEVLEEMGAEPIVYLPNRFTDGYGPNESVYKYYIDNHQVSLIITVDNGVAGYEAIQMAQEMGVDVIVTDHHSMPDQLPPAFAIVHPEHPQADYPFKYLAGCGVAFKLACALTEDIPLELLDLVAIGTIADMVSLTGENRILVKYGLEVLKKTQRVGLQELFQVAEITPTDLDEETVGFQIAPRLNALGRLDDPNPAIELLTGFDEEEGHEMALMINEKNEERKEIVQEIFDQARSMVDPEHSVQVLAHEGWNPGVLGIVAGRLLEELHQPVIVLNLDQGKAKGSARSVEAVNIFDALDPHRDLFLAFGGHAGAAGMTLKEENLDALRETLEDYIVENKLDLSQKSPLMVDEELSLSEVNLDTIKSFQLLAPFGMDNAKPLFLVKDFRVEQARTMGQGDSHLKLRIDQNGNSVDVVAFSLGNQVLEFSQAKNLELAVSLSVNQWNGQTNVQLMLKDARVEGRQLYDIRKKHSLYPEGVPILDMDKPQFGGQIVLDHVPDDFQDLRTIFQQADYQAVYFKNRIQKEYYLTGYGTREQFALLYKTIYQYPEFDVRHKLKALAGFLRIPAILLVKMIQIFEELGFVEIEDGVMRVKKDAARREIEESLIYQDLKTLVRYQETMALGTVEEIYSYLVDGDT